MNSTKTIEIVREGNVLSFTSDGIRKGGPMSNIRKILAFVKPSDCTITVKTAKGRVLSNMVNGSEMVKPIKHRAPKTTTPAVSEPAAPAPVVEEVSANESAA